jgi:hypothetical protein
MKMDLENSIEILDTYTHFYFEIDLMKFLQT